MCQAQDIPCGETDTHVSVRPNSRYKLDYKDKGWDVVSINELKRGHLKNKALSICKS